jgi:serine-type D-Ala-D-Ala carboxypeptidase/endopeptidase
LNPLSIGRQLVGGDPYAGYTHEDFHRNLAGLTLDAEPGAKMNYSNYGVALLGHALARRRGVSYDQLLRDELLAPLGMNDSAVTLDDAQEERFATGYRATFGIGRALVALRSLPWHLADHLAPAGGIRSTPRDMLRFLAVCMEREATPVSSAVKRSLEVLHRDNDHQAVGMNWLHTRVGPDDPTVLWHNGGTGGFRSYLGFTGDRRAGVVILANSKADTDSLGVRLVRLLHEHRSAPKPKP